MPEAGLTANLSVWGVLLISAGYYLGTQWTRIEEHIDVINNIIYVTIGVAIGVFFMRRWAHRRRQPRAAD